jgi:uncharacterized protein (DUF433 family)
MPYEPIQVNSTVDEHPLIVRVGGVCGGEPIVSGHRIAAAHIWSLMRKLKWTVERIMDSYPQLTRQQVVEAIRFIDENPGWRKDSG